MITAWSHEDSEANPLRTTIKIPLTYALLIITFDVIDSLPWLPIIKLAVKTAFSIGYGLSLRPAEYLFVGHGRKLIYTCSTSHSYFVWREHTGDIFINISDYNSYITRPRPNDFVTYIDKFKNDLSGNNGGPRAMSSDPTAQIDLVDIVWTYCKTFRPMAHIPLLASHGSHLTSKTLNDVLHIVAERTNLDPKRLLAYSLRSGILSQIADSDDETKMRQGFWTTSAGMKFYSRMSLEHSRSISKAIHDPAKFPLSHSQNFYQG